MFCSQFDHALDEKNRFKIPAALRDELGLKTYLIKSSVENLISFRGVGMKYQH